MELAISGQTMWEGLALRLRDAADVGLRRELTSAVQRGTRPAWAAVVGALPKHMPSGYAPVLAGDLDIRTSTVILGSSPGVSIRARPRAKQRKLRRLEAGVLAHPLFGDRRHWYTQTDGMTPRFFSGPLEDLAPEIRAEIIIAMAKVARQITAH